MKTNTIALITFVFILSTLQITAQNSCVTAVTIFPLTLQCGSSLGNSGEFPGDGTAPMNPCEPNYNDDEYWFQIVGNGTQAISVNITSITNSYVGVFLYAGCPTFGGTCIGSDVNTISTANLNITTVSPLANGVTHYVLITNWGQPDNTTFCLDATLITPPTPPANNNCTSPTALSVQVDNCTTYTVGSNINATNSLEGTPSCGDFQGGDVWYSINLTSTTDVTFDVRNVTWPFACASLYTGACGGLNEMTCTEFSTGWPFVFTGLTPGTYYLRVWDYSNNQTGSFEICAFSPPANQVPTSKCGGFSRTPNAIINDTNDPMDDLVVSGTGGQLIGDLNVVVRIDHSFLSDLEISLTSPAGTTVNLMFDKCLSNDNINIEYDDEGVPLVCGTPTIGTFIPTNGMLSMFDGEVFDGTWTLSVVDDSNGDHGTLVQWCLLPRYQVPCNMVAFATTVNVTCGGTNDGSATLLGSNGSEPYTFHWDAAAGNQTTATATGLAAGAYQATIEDGELCTAVIGVVINQTACNPCVDASLDICAILTNDPADPSGALDCDGDGAPNIKECSDLTDPRDPCFFNLGSVSLPVTADQSGCLNLCPDLSIITTILPGNISGMTTVCVSVEVFELNSIDTDGTPIMVRIPANPNFPIIWNTGCGLVPHNNANWTYTGSPFVESFTYVGPTLLGGESVAFAFEGMFNPGGSDGQTTLTATIVPGNGGGECNILNNTDAERLVYFN